MIDLTISHYKILEKLGEGGMGEVYLAEDTELDRKVALKFLPPHYTSDTELNKRFRREAKAAAALNHPNIITVHEIGEHEGRAYIAMEYVEGESLRASVSSGQLSVNSAVDIALQICDGLNAAHQAGVIHRDVKPENIIVDKSGRVRILDFGLARMPNVTKLTKESTTLGTISYMSPEQFRGEPVDHRADIWAVGVVLYEMLTGVLPFQGEYEQAVMYSVCHEEPEFSDPVTLSFQTILKKALSKKPDERYQTADEFANKLRAIAAEQAGGREPVVKQAKLPWLIAAAIVVLMAIALYIFLPVSKPVKDSVQTIAVLPFADMSPQKDQEYFSDGLAEELLNALAKNPKLRVTSRTSAFSFKGTNTDIRTIAEKLNVEHILEGSVRKSDNQIRVTAQLIDVATDAHLWSKTYDGKLENIFAVQDTISRAVAEALNVTLLGGATLTLPTKTKPKAYNAYLQGEHFYKLRGPKNREKALGYYEQALAIDSSYAPAWVGLSNVLRRQAGSGNLPFEEGYRKARQAAEKALALDPNLATAHVATGRIKVAHDWDWAGANAAFKRALDLEPGNRRAISATADLAVTLGRFEGALALNRRAIELDPVSVFARDALGLHAYYAGHLEEAEAAFRKVLELSPRAPESHTYLMLGLVYLEKGEPDSAMAEMLKVTSPVWRMFGLTLAYHAQGRRKEADAVLADFVKEYSQGWAYQIGHIYAFRGEADEAFAWLERAYQQRDPGLASIGASPLINNIKKDPRFAAFMKKNETAV